MIGGLIASSSIDKFAAFVTRDYIQILACLRGIRYRSVARANGTGTKSHLNASDPLHLPLAQSLQMHAEKEMACAELTL